MVHAKDVIPDVMPFGNLRFRDPARMEHPRTTTALDSRVRGNDDTDGVHYDVKEAI